MPNALQILDELDSRYGAQPGARITVNPAQPSGDTGGTPQGAAEILDELDLRYGVKQGPEVDGTVQPPVADDTTAVPGATPQGTPGVVAPPISLPAQDDPIWQTPPEVEAAGPQVTAVHNMLRQVNHRLASALALPSEAVNSILTSIGLGLVDKGAWTQHNKDAFEELGIRTDAINGISAQYGDAVADAIFQSMAFIVAAPYMAAQKGVTAGGLIVKHLGEQIIKYPGLVTAADIAGSVGTEFARQQTEGIKDPTVRSLAQPFAMLAGGLAAGVAGQGGYQAAKGVVSRAVAPFQSGARVVTDKVGLTTPEPKQAPVRPSDFSLMHTNLQTFAADQLKNDEDMALTGIVRAMESIPRTGTSAQVQARVRAKLNRAEEIARRIEREHWTLVDQKRQVPMSGIRQELKGLRDRIGDKLSTLPTIPGAEAYPKEKVKDFITRLENLSKPLRDPATGRMVQSLPSMEMLRDEYGRIARAYRRELSAGTRGESPNMGKVANYSKLMQILDDGLAQAYPNDIPLQRARAFSKKLHDMFDRGGIADITAMRARGDDRIPEGQTVEALMKKFEGLGELLDIRRILGYARQPGANRFAVTSDERRELQELVKETENAVRVMYREAAEGAGPDDALKAAKWFARNEKHIRPLAQVSAELEQSMMDVLAYHNRLTDLRRSALHKFVGYDPEKAITMVWNSKNPAATAEELIKTFRKDPDAMYAFRKSIIDQFWKATGMDPVKAKEVISQPRYRALLHNVLTEGGSGDWDRLNRMVDAAFRISNGEKSFGTRVARSGTLLAAASGAAAGGIPLGLEGAAAGGMIGGAAMITARVVGAGVGRQVAGLTGGGTVQVPGIFSSSFGRGMEKLLKRTPPQTLLTMAVQDPRWEKMLLSRVPTNTKEARKDIAYARRFLITLNTAREYGIERTLMEQAP